MLTINNLENIVGKEFQLGNGRKYLIGMVDRQPTHYSFVVFELDEKNVASISSAIVFELHKKMGNFAGHDVYFLSSTKMKQRQRIRPQNLTLRNFVLELQIKTALIVNK